MVSTRVKQARREILGLTQLELGIALGVDPVNVSRWERGIAGPSPSNLRKLAKLAKQPVSWFYEEAAA